MLGENMEWIMDGMRLSRTFFFLKFGSVSVDLLLLVLFRVQIYMYNLK